MSIDKLKQAAKELVALVNPTLKDYENYFSVARDLDCCTPDFGQHWDKLPSNHPIRLEIEVKARALLSARS
jgi:hypothetical protein